MTPSVDVLVVLYNSGQFIHSLFESLRRVAIPVNLYLLDNDSHDATISKVLPEISQCPFPVYLFRSLKNNGFARGVNLLARQSHGEYLFLLNPDAELEDGCLETLVKRAQSDSNSGVCEARQWPKEHPKTYDATTGETTWCSGARGSMGRPRWRRCSPGAAGWAS